MKIEMKGQEEVARAMRLLGKQAPRVMGRTLWLEGNQIMKEAQAITPVKEGILVNSGLVMLPEITEDGVSVTLGFGGAASDYAAIQHEEESYYHDPPTQYKFLEKPFVEAADDMGLRIAQDLWSKLK